MYNNIILVMYVKARNGHKHERDIHIHTRSYTLAAPN